MGGRGGNSHTNRCLTLKLVNHFILRSQTKTYQATLHILLHAGAVFHSPFADPAFLLQLWHHCFPGNNQTHLPPLHAMVWHVPQHTTNQAVDIIMDITPVCSELKPSHVLGVISDYQLLFKNIFSPLVTKIINQCFILCLFTAR